MHQSIDLMTFVATGHATTAPCIGTTVPVTLSGYYQHAQSDFYYYFSWKDGRLVHSPIGYSAAYLAAEHTYEQQHGPVDSASAHRRQLAFIATHLGIEHALE